MQTVELSNNPLVGSMPLLRLPQLRNLEISNTQLSGSLLAGFWDGLPLLNVLDLSFGRFFGVIPSAATPQLLFSLNLSENQFSGPVPANITSESYNVAFNQLSGPFVPFPGMPLSSLQTLIVAGNVGLTCPLQLAKFTSLVSLDIHGSGLASCDMSSADALPFASLVDFDMSDVITTPRAVLLGGNTEPPRLETLVARNASISSLAIQSTQLQVVQIDDNPLNTVVPWDPSLIIAKLVSFSARRCNLSLPIDIFVSVAAQVINLDDNFLVGSVPSLGEVSETAKSWLPTLQELTLSRNAAITGLLPAVNKGNQISTLDLSNTGVFGSIPSSWSDLDLLQQLSLKDTLVACQVHFTSNGQLLCQLPALLQIGSTTAQLSNPSNSNLFIDGVHCSQLISVDNELSTILIDPAYAGFTLCSCDPNYFGANAVCFACPASCICEGNVVKNCWPVIVAGLVQGILNLDGSASVSSVVPFQVLQLLPCADSVCNPSEVPWTQFYFLHTNNADNIADSNSLVPSNFCSIGYTSRLCSQCSVGWFSSGRFCSRCLSDGVHVLIVLTNMAVLVALVVYLWKLFPSRSKAQQSLHTYLGAVESLHLHDNAVSSGPSVVSSVGPEVRDSNSAPSTFSTSPLRLLIFHSQQLSLLLFTSASLPSAMNGLLAVFSSGSQGFSVASLTAMECLNHAWSLQHRCWAAVIAAMLIGLAAAVAYTRQWLQARRRTKLDRADGISNLSAVSSATCKVYSVCLSLGYLLLFPCAHTALTALACTDTRETDNATSSGIPSRVYLNLNPWMQCDKQWQREILPPALIAALIWCVMFPLVSTVILRRTHMRLMQETDLKAPSVLSVHAWTTVSDLLKPYSPRWWFFEQVLLLRRLLLVACVSFVSSSSIYLPLILLGLIQLAVLIQHASQPYKSVWMNRGELASLWLLQLNYIAAVISSSSNSEQGSGSVWFVLLFLANLCFLLVLVACLFSWLRLRVGPLLKNKLLTTVCARWANSHSDTERRNSMSRELKLETPILSADLSDPLLSPIH
jgi:hypothetical protein